MLTASRATVRALRRIYRMTGWLRSPAARIPVNDISRRNRGWQAVPRPDCWYIAMRSHDLLPGRTASVQIADRDLVAFRTMDGHVGVLDAYCPHLGADLRGGHVAGETLECPFHGLQWSIEGRCANNASLRSATRITDTTAYPVIERNGAIHVWISDGGPPTWEPPQFEDDLVEISRAQEFVDCHLAVEAMACYDDEHGFYAHRTTFDNLRFRTRPDLNEVVLDPEAPHTLGVVVVLEHRDLPLSMTFRATFYGPAICSAQLWFRFSRAGRERAVQGRTYTGLLPVGPDRHTADNAVYTRAGAPRSHRLTCAVLAFWVHTVMHHDDVTVWDYVKYHRGNDYYDQYWTWYDQFTGSAPTGL